MSLSDVRRIRIGHSPDPDDAFMYYAIAKGKVDTTQSKITVQLDSLKSDQSRRDGYIKGRTLDTRQFPAAILAIKDLQGLPAWNTIFIS